jgi:hypothetical protein
MVKKSHGHNLLLLITSKFPIYFRVDGGGENEWTAVVMSVI